MQHRLHVQVSLSKQGYSDIVRLFYGWKQINKYLEPKLILLLKKLKGKPQNGKKCLQYVYLTMDLI